MKLGAVEEETGDPVVMERSEIFYLYLTSSMCNDPLYNELRFNSADAQAADLAVATDDDGNNRDEDDDVLSTSPQPPFSPHATHHHHFAHNKQNSINRVNTFRSEQSIMNSSLMSVYSSNNPHHMMPNSTQAQDRAASPFTRPANGGKVDQVKEMSLLLSGLKRQATLKQRDIASATHANNGANANTSSPDGRKETGVVGKVVGGAEDIMIKECVNEFKRVTLAEMGFVLPHQQSYRGTGTGTGVYRVLSKDDREI